MKMLCMFSVFIIGIVFKKDVLREESLCGSLSENNKMFVS